MSKGKKLVVTVHGVASSGRWHEQVRRVLLPFFEVKPLRYTEFKGLLGGPRLVLWPIASAVLAIEAIIYWYCQPAREAVTATALLGGASLAAAIVEPIVRRGRARVRFKVEYERHAGGRRPHLIAHSFGTLLAANAMSRNGDVHFERIVFVGSIVGRGFNWSGLAETNDQAFEQVRNEVGKKDWVVRWLLPLAVTLIGRGGSGYDGFDESCGAVHGHKPNQRCRACSGGVAPRHSIHNVFHDVDHSEFVKEGYTGHIRNYWLPYFLELDPWEYGRFLNMAVAVYEAGSADAAVLRGKTRAFRRSVWYWTRNRTVATFMREAISGHLATIGHGSTPGVQPSDIIQSCIRTLCTLLASAIASNSSAEETPKKLKRELALNPPVAIARVVHEIVKTRLKYLGR